MLIFTSLNLLRPTKQLFFSVFLPPVENMSEVSSLHDSLEPRGRGGRSQPPPLPTVYDRDEAMSTISSVSQHAHRRDDYPRRGGGHMGDRVRARSMDNLDDIGRRYGRDDYPPRHRPDEPRGRRGWVIVVASLLPWARPLNCSQHQYIFVWTAGKPVKFNNNMRDHCGCKNAHKY